MQFIETHSELQAFLQIIRLHKAVCFPMWVDNSKHPCNTHLSFIFIACNGGEYVLSVNHTDTLPLTLEDLATVINDGMEVWSFQKKKLLQSLQITTTRVHDVDTAYFLESGQTIDYEALFHSVFSQLTRHGYHDDLTPSTPIMKLTEVIQSVIYKYPTDSSHYNFKWYNDTVIPTLAKIESTGLRVDRTKLLKRFPHSEKHLTSDNLIYTEYNPFTVTGRPSCRHGGINFSALNKTDGTRDCFIADGIFLQMDYDAYHPRLIGQLINYSLPSTSVHQWLADQYGCSYSEGKGVTFRLLYGGIDDTFKQIPYFAAVAKYIDDLWILTKKQGYIQTKYRRIPLDWVENADAQKTFNYLLQALETEVNMDTLVKLDPSVKMRLYLYDSFLFDYPTNESIDIAKKLKSVIESNGCPVKASWSTCYGNL